MAKIKITKIQTIVLSSVLRFTDSDYPFGIFKLLLQNSTKKTKDQALCTSPQNLGYTHMIPRKGKQFLLHI